MNYFYEIYILDNSYRLSILISILVVLFVFLTYNVLKLRTIIDTRFINKINEAELLKKEYQHYLLFLGITVPIIEIIFQIYKIRPQSLLLTNATIGLVFLSIYFLSTKSASIFRNIKSIFTVIFFIYFGYIARNIVFLTTDIIPIIAFVLCFLISFVVLKPIKVYWCFVASVFLFLIIVLVFEIIPIKTSIILLNYCFLTLIVNYIRHITLVNITDKLKFTDEIINKGNMLTIATNKKGELSFCSETVVEILGYKPEEVLGLNFWILTEDPEFVGEDYHLDYKDDRLHVRKLKCKNGEYKFIQWKDKKFSDNLVIGVGQDVTNENRIQNQYKNLVQNATDIIFEVDNNGNFTFVNEFTIKCIGFDENEILNKNYSQFIQKDHVNKIMEFYENLEHIKDDFPTIELPIVKKNGEELWISQKVIIRKNDLREIIGYSGIARDISILKNIEKENLKRQQKIEKYNETLKDFTAKSYSSYENFDSILKNILEITTKTLNVNRASYWNYFPDKIKCLDQYELNKGKFEKGFILTKKNYPNYFITIENEMQIVAPDVYSNAITKELCADYIPNNKIVSLLDTPVFINGELKGIICFEATETIKNWDNEDISFARSVSDLIVIAIESQMRLEAEQALAYKSELLSAMAMCTEKFLLSDNQIKIFCETYPIIGKVTNADHFYYYENDTKTNLIRQKYKWGKENIELQITPLRNFTHDDFFEILEKVKKRKYFNSFTRELNDTVFKKLLIDNDIKSILIFPIFIKDEFTGFIGLDDCTNERRWSEDEINILQTLASNIASSIERIANERVINESEEKFRLLANNIPGTAYLSKYDETSTKVYINDKVEILTGYSKSDFIDHNLSYLSLIHPDDRQEIMDSQRGSLALGIPFHSIYRIRKKSGEYIWVEEFGDAISKNNTIEYTVGIYFDITDKKESEEAIKAKEYAEAASKAKSEFLANMTHEIRTPLNGIIGFTDLLMNTKLEEFQKQYMNTINQSANSLMEVISDILDFSKIESGKLELHIEEYNIIDLCNQVIELIKYETETKDIKLILTINKEVPKFLQIDYIRIKQILINLLSNALKFTEKGTIELNVTSIETIKNSCKLRFYVKDTGIGIKKVNQGKIFEAFSQEDSSMTKKFGGTGLGLTISNQLLNLMNSRLQLESEFGKGSTFFFDIAFKIAKDIKLTKSKKISIPTQIQETINKPKFENQQPTVLIIEDNKINMLLAKTLIKQIIPNSSIHEAFDGKEGVEKYKEINPDIIFMDIQMPIMNGYEATREIRKLQSSAISIPIIALTAGTILGEKEKCLEAGMDDYASKPFVKDTIEKIILKWMKG